MLTLQIPEQEFFNEKTNEFSYSKAKTLQLEHSLISLKKWEAMYQKAFMSKSEKTKKETLDYIRCMTINQDISSDVYHLLTADHYKQIKDYIDSPMSATTFRKENNQRGNNETITAEIIYYWMIENNIPFECQKWHLNSLLTLIRVCALKNGPTKKMNKKDILRQNAQLNAERKARLNSRG